MFGHKITGILHLTALSFIALYLFADVLPKSLALLGVLFFLIKGISFAFMKQNPVSALDAVAGFYLLFPVMGTFSNIILTMLFIGFLAQKGVVYLFR